MFKNLSVFSTASAMAKHAARAQAQIAENTANADTPGYKARYLRDFETTFRSAPQGGLKATRAKHLHSHHSSWAATRESKEIADPNGNNVSLEEEMFAAALAEKEHSRALTLYRHGLTVLRTSIGGAGR